MSKEEERKKKKKERESLIEKELYAFIQSVMRQTIDKALDDLLKDFNKP